MERSYLTGSKCVSVRRSDPDTMTNTALEAIASSSGKKAIFIFVNLAHRYSFDSMAPASAAGMLLLENWRAAADADVVIIKG